MVNQTDTQDIEASSARPGETMPDDDGPVGGHHSLPSPEQAKTDAAMSASAKSSVCNRRRYQIFFAVASVIAVVCIVVLGVMLTENNKSSSKAVSTPTGIDRPSRANEAIDLLSAVTPRAVLEDDQSPQHKAAVWLADYDERQVAMPTSISGNGDAHFIQRYVLATMFYAMDGENWRFNLEFLTGHHECDWHQYFSFHGRGLNLGVTCDFDFRIKKLMNFGNRLQGSIPPEIGLLTDVVEVDLFANSITGSLPTEMSKLTQLDFLAVQRNSLAGPVPDWLGDMSALKVLSLGDNLFTGSLPSSMARMNLEEVYLDENALTGDVQVLTEISTLRLMYAENNQLDGAIQDMFVDAASSGNLRSLEEVDLSGNQIGGTLPRSLLNLRLLDLHDNKLAGPFPAPTGDAEESYGMEFLALYKNQMSGELPETVHKMPKLTHLDLSLNTFTGAMPDFGISTSQLTYLFLSKNQFTAGPVPSSMHQLANLRELSLKGTGRTGTIPDFVGDDLTGLVMLDLGENELDGSIPPSLGNLRNCSFMLLNDNGLVGSVPSSFGSLDKLVLLLLDDNSLVGSASAVCSSKPESLSVFIADCDSEVECSCCTECCSDDDDSCNDRTWLANYDPMWETGYSRAGKEYVFGDDVKLVSQV